MSKKAISFLTLILLLASTLTFSEIGSVEGQTLEEIEEELREVERERQNVNQELSSLQDRLSEIEAQQAETKSELDQIVGEIEQTELEIQQKELDIDITETEIKQLEEEINVLEEEIADLESEIEQLEEEIVITEERIDQREDLLKNRLRALQRNGGSVQYIEVVLGAKDFGEFISRASAASKLMDQDQSIISDHFDDKEYLEETVATVEQSKLEVEGNKEEVEGNKTELEDKHNTLMTQKQELDSLVASLEQRREEQNVVLASLEEEEDHIEDIQLSLEEEEELLSRRESVLEDAKRAAQSDSGGSSSFMTPTTGYISSHFNPNRVHPIYGTARPHNGVDIANSRGTAINVAATGVVYDTITGCVEGNMSCGGGFGNAVFVSHVVNGEQFDTVYAHLQSVQVNPGQTVSQGQQVGTMGSTGSSTGPHLHFEIHPGGYGNAVNPMNYISAP
ncbi:murein hydrolase activator EnvC family protein [Alkalibacillus aidingensis]|uniref:murein hydrolase activator EnvC family protein n=1 Tax=Alkalibacillus aidingensis TaxID=2747607 RepID=UPI001661163C|nr:peptidoglycan DD-metalloendopeptidase family protein [Alkalibacillus aidingensis]